MNLARLRFLLCLSGPERGCPGTVTGGPLSLAREKSPCAAGTGGFFVCGRVGLAGLEVRET